MKSKDYRIFYFSELHGSYLCFYKVINLANCKDRPNIIIIGGDICGNKIVPICKTDNSNRNKFISSAKYEGKDILFENYDIQNRFVEFISYKGDYGWICTKREKLIFENYPLEREKIIEKLKINRFRKWLRILNGSLNDYHSDIYFVPGTDDPLIIDELIEKNKKVNLLNNKIIKINNSFSLLGFSYSSYNCQSISEEHRFKSFYRNISEENFRDKFWELISKYEDKNDLSHYIFCIPYPPKNTNLDYDSNKRIHFGCEKLKEIIDITKPKYSLHSFIYENRYDSINETVLLNPGSYFNNGKIVFYVIDYKAGIFKHLHYNNDPFKNINLQREDYNSNSINKNYVDLIRYIIDIIPFGATFVKIERLIKHLIKMKNETILIEQKNEINNLINRLLKNKK